MSYGRREETDMAEQEAFGPPWNIKKLLMWTTNFFQSKGLESPRFEAELLLGHSLSMPRVMLYAHHDRPVDADELTAYRALVKRRAAREPIAYITGKRGFWTIELKTDRRALIPRPETELVVERALALLPADQPANVLDIGTGTGAIALSIAGERPLATLVATDLSADALALARENAEALGLSDRVNLVQSDLLKQLDGQATGLDLIVSNPPYIGTSEQADLMPEVRDWEPASALFSGVDGLDIIRELAVQAHGALRAGGHLLCEIGYQQGPAVKEIFERAGFEEVTIFKDLQRHDRVVQARR
jgi:release factor glutamine methyltransferase